MRVEGGRIVPASRFDADTIRSLPEGSLWVVERFRDTRKKERFFHMLIRRVADNAFDDFATPDRIKSDLFKELGFVKGTITEVDGATYELRMATNELSSEQLEIAIERLLFLAETEYCPGIDVTALKREAKGDAEPSK